MMQHHINGETSKAASDAMQEAPQDRKKTSSSVHDLQTEKPPFGSRFLTEESDVWSKNAWDHVPPPDDQGHRIASALARQRSKPVPVEDKTKYNEKPAKHWDNFYKMNEDNFFQERKWLHLEFPELVSTTQPNAGEITIAELGCGTGSSIFPLLSANQNPHLKLFAFDYASHAVKLVQRNELYLSPPAGTIHSSVWDLTSESLPEAIQPDSVDIIILIFVLSALHPNEWTQAITNIQKMLKPGGLVVMRDYGRHDMTQLRFKEGRLLEENLYIRGDKTRVYFFDLDDLSTLFTGSPTQAQGNQTEIDVSTTEEIIPDEDPNSSLQSRDAEESSTDTGTNTENSILTSTDPTNPANYTLHTPVSDTSSASLSSLRPSPPSLSSSSLPTVSSAPTTPTFPTAPSLPLPHPLFRTEQLGIDRRLLVNRKRQLKMYRVWVQGKFRKL